MTVIYFGSSTSIQLDLEILKVAQNLLQTQRRQHGKTKEQLYKQRQIYISDQKENQSSQPTYLDMLQY